MKTSKTDNPSESSSKSKGYVVTIPLATLATNDGTSDVAPAVGDSVDIQATGTVKSIEGDSANITIDSINGNSISTESPPESPPADTAESLRSAAQTADESNFY